MWLAARHLQIFHILLLYDGLVLPRRHACPHDAASSGRTLIVRTPRPHDATQHRWTRRPDDAPRVVRTSWRRHEHDAPPVPRRQLRFSETVALGGGARTHIGLHSVADDLFEFTIPLFVVRDGSDVHA